MNQKEINKKLLEYVFTTENLVNIKFIREKMIISNDKNSNERKYFDRVFSQLKNVGIIKDDELNLKYIKVYQYSEMKVKFILESLLPLVEEYITQRYSLMRHFRKSIKNFPCEGENDRLSDKLTSDIIIKYKEYIHRFKNIKKENEIKELEILEIKYSEYIDIFQISGIDQPIKILETLKNAILDLLDRLICNISDNIDESYNLDMNKDSLYKIVFKDICFKEVLFYILEGSKESVESEDITDIISNANKSLNFIVKGKKTKDKYKNQIINALFELKIFVGDRQEKKPNASYTVGPTTIGYFDTEWKMNSITKLESILFIVGKLTDIQNLSDEKRYSVLKIFNFTIPYGTKKETIKK